MRLLIAENFNLSHVDENWHSLLHDAYECASLRIVTMLLDAGLDSNATTFNGTVPWHFVATNPDETVLAHLIASGIDVNAANPLGVSLAHRACQGSEKVLATLIAAGADPTCRASNGDTLCHFAAWNYNVAVMAMLIPVCDVNVADNDGCTPFIVAADCENFHVLELLIGAGANVHAVADDGTTALSVALVQG